MYENSVANVREMMSQWERQARMPGRGGEMVASGDQWRAHGSLPSRRGKLIALLVRLKARLAVRSGEASIPEPLPEIFA